jgi:hypothetical protein
MEKQYVYRKHLREPGKSLGAMMAFILLIFCVFGAAFLLSVGKEKLATSAIIFLGVGVVVFLIIGIEFVIIYHVLYKRFKNISTTLTNEGIIYRNIKGETFIAYEDIQELRFPSIKYAGGWLKIVHKHGDIRLTVVLENIGEFLKNLKEELDQRGMFQVYDEKAIYSFYKTAYYSDQSWQRVYDYIKGLLLFVFGNLAISVIFAALTKNDGFRFISVITGSLFPTIAFLIAEAIVGRKLAIGASKEDFSVPARDKTFELKTYRRVFGIYSVVYILFLVFLYLV